ncbi:MAG: hypothetical protein J7K85_09330 [Anaerolineaceae bacterium]|nr:hypothetical protein [Anaerolineaceae bacterium]
MPKTQLPCPNCGQPVVADVQQLFDVAQDPEAKKLFLSGQANVAVCQSCGYQGPVHVPVVYHDPEKELLLTYFPPELNTPLNRQEQIIGPMVRKVMDNLPAEQRKGYLFKPQTMLTFKRMMEVVLEADGITPEMMKRQQDRLQLLQRLVQTSEESLAHIVDQDAAIIDEEFFQLLNSLVQMTSSQGDQEGAQKLVGLQQFLFENTEKGKELKAQVDEAQAAITSLQEASQDGGLTQEKLLDLIIDAQTDIRLITLVNYAYQGLDYTFFSLLAQRIEKTEEDEKIRLMELRDRLLEMRQEIDKELAEQMESTRKLITEIINTDPMEEALGKNAQLINQGFVDVLQGEMARAQQELDVERGQKLQKLMDIINEATKAPAEILFAQELLATETEKELDAILEARNDEINDELAQSLGMLIQQTEGRQDVDQATKERLELIYGKVLKISMRKNMAK